MPSASVTHTASIDTDIDTAWDHMQEIDTWAGVGPVSYAKNARHHDDGTLAGFDWGAEVGGKTYSGTAEVVKADRPESFKLDLTTSEIVGSLSAELTPTGDTCAVEVTLRLSTKGMLSTMFFPAIKAAVASGFPQQVDDLAAGF